MSEEKGFHGSRDSEDWYDNGPGSESWKRKMAKEQAEWDAKRWQEKRDHEEEFDRLQKENKELKEKLELKKND